MDVRDDVRSGREPKLKIVWNYKGRPSPPYFVPVKMLKDRASDARDALQRLMDKGMSNGGILENCGKELKEIAEAGYKLYGALFHPGDGFDATRIKEWLNREKAELDLQGKQAQISFTVDSLVHIPWGLIYDSSPELLSGNPEDDEINLFENFWCLKYKLSSVYYRILPEGLSDLDSTNLTGILSIVHKAAFDKAARNLIDPEDKILQWVTTVYGEPLDASKTFYQEWQSKGEKVRLLYFYCHANRSNLALSSDDEISMTDFRQETAIPRSTQESTCVVFLNGCNTAAGDPDGAFLEATGELLFCGFVGTETKVPDVFALRFGLAFLYYFLHEGWPVFRIIDHLRRQHWPLSITYSTYCPPMLRFNPAEKSLSIEIKSNFSRMPLGTSQM